MQAVEVAAAARLGAGILAIALDANTAMTAAINTTPSPNLEPSDPGSTTPSDASVEQAAEDTADQAGPASNKDAVRRLYDQLSPGRRKQVRVVDSEADLRQLFEEMTVGGKPVPPGAYPGIRVQLPDGTLVMFREQSGSGGATIDIRFPNGQQGKVHIDGE